MALVKIENITEEVKIGFWNIEETPDVFCGNYPCLAEVRHELLYKSDKRLSEVLAVRALICEMTDRDVKLTHDSAGRPFLSNGMNVSVSHTQGFAVVILSRNNRVAVDIERISDKVVKVADRFLRSDEVADSLLSLHLHWCTKETMYKMFSTDDLKFMEMRLLSVKGDNANGVIVAKNLLNGKTIDVFYRVFDSLVLTYSVI